MFVLKNIIMRARPAKRGCFNYALANVVGGLPPFPRAGTPL